MKKILAVLLVVAMVFTFAACGKTEAPAPAPAPDNNAEAEPAPAPAADPITFKVSMSNDEANFMSIAWKHWGEAVTEATEGRVDFQWYWSNTLIDSNEGWDNFLAGIADIADVHRYENNGFVFSEKWKSLTSGVPKDAVVDFSYKLFEEFPELCAEYDDCIVLAQGYNGGTVYNLLTTNKKVETVADMKGLVIWCEADWNDFLTECGATPVNTPWSEVYSSLQKNMYDGLMIATETMKSCMFAEVCHYVTEIDVAYTMGPGELMNKDSWAKLSAEDQQAMLDCAYVVEQEQLEEFAKVSEESKQWAIDEYGAEFVVPTPEAKAEFDECLFQANLKAAEAIDAKGFPATKVVEALNQWTQEWNESH